MKFTRRRLIENQYKWERAVKVTNKNLVIAFCPCAKRSFDHGCESWDREDVGPQEPTSDPTWSRDEFSMPSRHFLAEQRPFFHKPRRTILTTRPSPSQLYWISSPLFPSSFPWRFSKFYDFSFQTKSWVGFLTIKRCEVSVSPRSSNLICIVALHHVLYSVWKQGPRGSLYATR
jgi:hypothetical protein